SAQPPFGPMAICDYWDPDGTKGIHAVVLIMSAAWCMPCQMIASTLRTVAPPYIARGARILEVLTSGADNMLPATQATLDLWIGKFGVISDVARAEPSELYLSDMDAFPTSTFIDPRTMRITSRIVGTDAKVISGDTIPELDKILAKNGH